MKPRVAYFKTEQQAHDAMQPWIDQEYPTDSKMREALRESRLWSMSKGLLSSSVTVDHISPSKTFKRHHHENRHLLWCMERSCADS
jgi:hypothetical protein